MNGTEKNGVDLYDLSDIRLITNNDDSLFVKILTVLVEMLSSEGANIRELAKSNNWKEVAELVHKLKTSLTHIKATSVKTIIFDLEDYQQYSNEKLAILANQFCDAVDNMLIYLKKDLAAANA